MQCDVIARRFVWFSLRNLHALAQCQQMDGRLLALVRLSAIHAPGIQTNQTTIVLVVFVIVSTSKQ